MHKHRMIEQRAINVIFQLNEHFLKIHYVDSSVASTLAELTASFIERSRSLFLTSLLYGTLCHRSGIMLATIKQDHVKDRVHR